MGKTLQLLLMMILLSCAANNVVAQFSGNNLMQFQYGELPGDTKSQATIYDRATLNYNYKMLNAGVTLEQFYSPIANRNYTKLSQYSLQFDSKYIDITAGNYYETLGRGLLLRSYEIPGAILEDLSYRSQHYFHRDIQGFNAKLQLKDFKATVLYGKPLNNVFPPVLNDSLRRTDEVAAVYSEYSFKKQSIGAAVLHLSNQTGNTVYGMATLYGTLFPFLNYYMETAKKMSDSEFTDYSSASSYALYGGLNFSYNNLGLSAEFKNYHNFLIGSGINEPPALVKEHTYKVLNRSTHVLQPTNEKGYQLEVYYTFPDLSSLTLNNTLAVNNFGQQFIFREYFAEYDFTLSDNYDFKLFADYADDPFKSESQRVSAGAYIDWNIFRASTLKTDYEFQTFKRFGESVQNHVMSLTYAYKSKLAFNITGEISTDKFLINNYKSSRMWLGTNLKYRINEKNTALLFAGQRRGGPACNAGICYEVLDFSGVELRVTTRL